jgi:uncharacterized repeat protein (TIGR01451 family)
MSAFLLMCGVILAPSQAGVSDPPTPVVQLRIRVAAVIAPGAEIEYRITAENPSRAEAHHVIVSNPVPANARFVRSTPEPTTPAPNLTWNLGTLPPCSSREIVLVLASTANTDVANCARVTFEHGQCVMTRIEKPAGLSIRNCGPSQAGVNETIPFQIAVSNRGTVPLTNVHVLVKLGDGLTHSSGRNTLAFSVGTLQPGQCEPVQYQVTATRPGRLCCHAGVSADGGVFDETESCVTVVTASPLVPIPAPGPGGTPPPGGVPAPAQVPPVPPGKLVLAVQGPPQRYINRPATYQITVSNPGPGPITNVVVTDFLPAGTNAVTISDAGRRVGEQVQWLIGTVPAGGKRTVQIALQAGQPAIVINRATATADGGLMAQAEAKTTFEGATGLTFDIESKDNPVDVGAQTTYIVTVLNQGNIPANKVQITITLPEQVQFLGGRGPTDPKQEGRVVTFEPLDSLKPRSEMRYEINVKAIKEGEAKVRVELRADQLGNQPIIREQTTIISP